MLRFPIVSRSRLLLVPLLFAAIGCGTGRYPVTGQVVYEDGSPVEGGTVIAEADIDGKPVGVQGNIAKDGAFSWGADKPDDGALPGHYRVLLMPVALSQQELSEGKRPAISGKYGKFDTSGIEFDVKAEKNVLKITVKRPQPRAGDE